jgi:hypothetical protein
MLVFRIWVVPELVIVWEVLLPGNRRKQMVVVDAILTMSIQAGVDTEPARILLVAFIVVAIRWIAILWTAVTLVESIPRQHADKDPGSESGEESPGGYYDNALSGRDQRKMLYMMSTLKTKLPALLNTLSSSTMLTMTAMLELSMLRRPHACSTCPPSSSTCD